MTVSFVNVYAWIVFAAANAVSSSYSSNYPSVSSRVPGHTLAFDGGVKENVGWIDTSSVARPQLVRGCFFFGCCIPQRIVSLPRPSVEQRVHDRELRMSTSARSALIRILIAFSNPFIRLSRAQRPKRGTWGFGTLLPTVPRINTVSVHPFGFFSVCLSFTALSSLPAPGQKTEPTCCCTVLLWYLTCTGIRRNLQLLAGKDAKWG